MAPLLRDSQGTGPKPSRLGRADLVTEAAAEWPFPPSDVLWPLGPGCKADWPHPEVAALFPLAFPQAPAQAAVAPSRPPGSPSPRPETPAAPNDAEPQARGRPPWSQLRYSPSCHWAPLSHHNHRRLLFLTLLGDPPTSFNTNEKRGQQETVLRRAARAFPAVKRSCSVANGVGNKS